MANQAYCKGGAMPIELIGPLVTALTVMATAVMAASAAIQSVRHEFDVFGAMVLSAVTAVGGGTIRDLLIGATPVFWIQDYTYLATSLPVGLATFMFAKRMRAGHGRRLRLLMYFDAVGLALFTILGIKVGLAHHINPAMAVLLGCVTGIAGGMMRDMLCGFSPSVLREDLYATVSIVGGAIYVLTRTAVSEVAGIGVSFLAMIVVRVIIVSRIRLPADA